AIRLARQYGLNILNLTWEDTGRYKNSSVGPNISDMTIQVQQRDPYSGNYNLTCMPVIRFPNFSDRTGDVDLDKLYILVGNEKAEGLKRVSLREFLGDIRKYMSEPGSWKGSRRSLLAPRDSHVLVSAQACFLPIPREGTAEFNPVLFNYQSVEGDPAVLTILATREGTSITVIDNKRDGFNAGGVWGQRLFFNQNGERASLTGKRLSDYLNNNDEGYSANSRPDETEALNMVMLIQVPLKQKNPMRCGYVFDGCAPMVSYKYESALKCKEAGNVENAVIGHGRVEGPFTEIAGLDIERDPAYPIRVTVQFYKATSNGIVTEHDMKQMAEQIGKVYAKADYVGSLVVGGDTRRPTEYTGDKNKPCNWWREFWSRQVARPKWGLN
ncbi:MAG TPA: hypothetical protein PLA52_06040, partial [Candidatus Omnitrophota bacterium]|nr:hypothetical protein [Candidatus Omnitrophota bacterium]